ncbi:MAG TPA: transglycosylase domain-containing protein [Solirubrobacteraceae bacterium]|jgi:penicillin-binding protein 1A|nr:transglycosylase domain-containing protein [Solirubrobacteraceae bacterium]
MSDDDRPDITHDAPTALVLPSTPQTGEPSPDEHSRSAGRTRLKRLRFLAILAAVLLLGAISFLFGIFVSVAADLPSLTRFALYKNEKSSMLYDDLGHPIGVLSQQNRVILTAGQIPRIVKNAVVSIEDKRFWTNSGIDLRGIARAVVDDIEHRGAAQGASTIEQQFIKNALQAQSHRTIFEKLREAALAYQLSHKWSKEKIITAYLNTIYFGNGAYGIEAAAQTYFGHEVNHLGCGLPGHELCVEHLAPWEAALLAGIIQSPTEYDPATHPVAARERREVVLQQMLDQGYLSRTVYDQSITQALPSPQEIQAPQEQTVEGVDAGYFTSWAQQQVIERYGAQRSFDGGLKITTTLDLELQRAAEQAVNNYLAYTGGPTASLVAIENSTGDVRAMVGGRNYDESPFNLATQGQRQPGSSFKAFDLAAALEDGISPDSVWTSKEKAFIVPRTGGHEKFVVHNDEGNYTGSNTLTGATAFSDNSIFAEVGLKVGTQKIALLAHRMGITTPLSTNPAMTIGGLTVGVTPLDMAHAYETLAHGGERVTGSLVEGGVPVGIQQVEAGSQPLPNGSRVERNSVRTKRVLPASVAETETTMLESVIQYGTGKAAAIGQFAAGKTGTTSNYGDAWFVGWDSKFTVAVWVGYPNKLIPMTTDFNGTPVLGGTFPALIWHDFMMDALAIEKERAEHSAVKHGVPASSGESSSGTSGSEAAAAQSAPSSGQSKSQAGQGNNTKGGNSAPNAGTQEAPSETHAGEHAATPAAPAAPATPAPAEAAPTTPPASTPPASSSPSPTGGVGAP